MALSGLNEALHPTERPGFDSHQLPFGNVGCQNDFHLRVEGLQDRAKLLLELLLVDDREQIGQVLVLANVAGLFDKQL